MRRRFISVVLLSFTFCCTQSIAQYTIAPKDTKRQFFGLTPSDKNRIISGIAIGLTAHPWAIWEDTFYVKVNGLNIEVGPLGIVGGIWGTMYGLMVVRIH